MAAFRLYSQLDTFNGQEGQLLTFGKLKFYEAESSIPKDVYGTQDLTPNNGPEIDLDASGRPALDIWGEGSYFVELYDSDDVKQGEADHVEIPGGAALDIPIPDEGEFLTGDGSQFLTAAIRQVPDPTGSANKVLGTDGTALSWVAQPTIPQPDIVIAAGKFQAGTSASTTKFLIQTGTDTAPATNWVISEKTVTFPIPFVSPPFVKVAQNKGSVTQGGYSCDVAETNITATTFNASFNSDHGDAPAGAADIAAPFAFSWFAAGLVVVEAP